MSIRERESKTYFLIPTLTQPLPNPNFEEEPSDQPTHDWNTPARTRLIQNSLTTSGRSPALINPEGKGGAAVLWINSGGTFRRTDTGGTAAAAATTKHAKEPNRRRNATSAGSQQLAAATPELKPRRTTPIPDNNWSRELPLIKGERNVVMVFYRLTLRDSTWRDRNPIDTETAQYRSSCSDRHQLNLFPVNGQLSRGVRGYPFSIISLRHLGANQLEWIPSGGLGIGGSIRADSRTTQAPAAGNNGSNSRAFPQELDKWRPIKGAAFARSGGF